MSVRVRRARRYPGSGINIMMLKSSRARRLITAAFTATTTIAASGPTFASGDAVRGENLYRTCMACHSPYKNGVGPRHNGVFGSKAGSVAGYDYSDALKNSGIVWNGETLDPWLANPQALVPGAK